MSHPNRLSLFLSLLLSLVAKASSSSLFPFETVQLSPTSPEVLSFPSVQFASQLKTSSSSESFSGKCRAWPNTPSWPSDEDWDHLNTTLEGALLRPLPAAAACYPGPQQNQVQCSFLTSGAAGNTHFWLDNPVETLTQWPAGWGCLLGAPNATGSTCERGGWPEYVVNASTVKHVQAAVNFARNKEVRLIIKNTGHDFGGRSMGAGSLSVWTHNLKSLEYIPDYTIKSGENEYSGPAVRVGAGVETWELFNHMAENNITVVAPGGGTVGPVGGWFSVAGHGGLASKYGLGADQVLEVSVVTADGMFLTVGPNSPEPDSDLWWALRGGGGSTFGVVTSVVFKAYPPITTMAVSLNFGLAGFPINGTTYPLPIEAVPGTRSPPNTNFITAKTAFWDGVAISYRYCNKVIAVGGYCFSYIHPLGNNSFGFTSSQQMPNITASAATALLSPLYAELRALGIPVDLPTLTDRSATLYAGNGRRTGATNPANTRYRSRLFPARNWEEDDLYNKTFAAIRAGVEEGGLVFHGIAYSPTLEVAGWPGSDSAVNPAWRDTVLHGILMEATPVNISAGEARQLDEHSYKYTDVWKQLTPGAGSYMNEGDPVEKDWQWSFYGHHYRRLLGIKRRRDPWGVFWARTTVGSEEWEVVTEDGFPGGQNGKLCRVSR
ncbi:hypothetical protein QBC43DRAFT_358936 [Cladorrhinum sp. PSN259]|nr:hypothetical protein QBC43DRAFT_358936 [Cladorrhinum sp. PSN259]